ncbi:protein of unknown function [Methylocella tundrae]|uniref:Uncharacterized protein n=1 Tax=Methylocella tundrae TaxID=227605 RepID=A0A4U8YZ17_METTU|nr:protein of unknown function [Methylocella tundrae]
MEDAKAEMVFTDPPYNVAIEGHVSGLEESDRLGEGQWRHGFVLSLPARADLRVQERDRRASQQFRAWPAWTLPDERLGVSRRQHPEGRTRR